MKTLCHFLHYQVKTIALVDSQEDGPEMMLPYWDAEIAGYKAVHVPHHLQRIDDIVSFIRERAEAAICTHRLSSDGSLAFSGAELAAALYDAGIPCLLVTQYLDIDQHSSIRRWRHKLPVVLHLRELDPQSLKEQLDFCVRELQGQVPECRVPYRVLVGVVDMEAGAHEQYLDVSVDCWDHYQRLRIPLSLLPPHLHACIRPGSWLFANVNIEAEYAHELYFRSITLAPTPEFEENLTYCEPVWKDTSLGEHRICWFEDKASFSLPFDVTAFKMSKEMYN